MSNSKHRRCEEVGNIMFAFAGSMFNPEARIHFLFSIQFRQTLKDINIYIYRYIHMYKYKYICIHNVFCALYIYIFLFIYDNIRIYSVCIHAYSTCPNMNTVWRLLLLAGSSNLRAAFSQLIDRTQRQSQKTREHLKT